MEGVKKFKPAVSPSQINLYNRCGEAYRRRYIENDKIPPGIALVKGSAVHKGAEENFRQKITTQKDLAVGDVTMITVQALETQVQHEGLLLSPEDEAQGKAAIVGKAKDSVAKSAGVLMAKVAPRYQPALVEEAMVVQIEGATHDLRGIIDLMDTRNVIVDVKTSGKTWAQSQADKSSQLTFYSMLYRSKFGKDPAGLTVENIVDKEKPDVNTLSTSRTMDDYRVMIQRINRTLEGIKKGVFPPASDQGWWCDPRYCGYYATCKLANPRA